MLDGSGSVGDTPMLASALSDIGMIELLECDTKPTFVLDLERVHHPDHDLLHAVYSNASLKRLPTILDPAHVAKEKSVGDSELDRYSDFKEWAISSPESGLTTGGHITPFKYHNLSWTCSTLRKRWRIISGSAMGLRDHPASPSPNHRAGLQERRQGTGTASRDTHVRKEEEDHQTGLPLTWIDDLPTSEHVQLFKSINWSATALGPLETWSVCLRQMTHLLMADSRAAALFWYRPRAKWLNECC